ncbi:MAG TPA: glycine oxidase ThiO [Candidatus Acidoferrales bacterium]|nr:glycine oxidase ThiO [Candidatus Acidoferrales bacterium]
MKAADVAIIGGGVIGASIACELSAEKLNVVVFDRQRPGLEASWAAAGMLSPGPDSLDALPLVPLAKESMRMYPDFVASVEKLSGKTIGLARIGTLEIFTSPGSESERDRMVAQYRALGLAIEPISLDDAKKAEPSLGPTARAAALLPQEATLDPRLLMEALLEAARNRGVEIHADSPVTSVLMEGNRATGIIAGGKTFAAKCVIVAAGCFSGGIDWLARYAPTRPVRGQLLALESKDIAIGTTLRSAKAYLVPRSSGRIIAGSTLEEAGFDKHVTPAGMRKILDGVLELAPALASAQVVDYWAGLRPGTPDNLPILGPTDIEGLFMATGHYRNGILLAPATAKLMSDWVLGRKPALANTEVFSPLRFGEAKLRAPKIASAIS